MRSRTPWTIAACLVLAATAAAARPSKPASVAEFFSTLKVGQWVKCQGVPQGDQSIQCTESKVLTGDFMDDDWGISGMVRRVDAKKQEVTIYRYQTRMRDNAEYQSDARGFEGFGDIAAGMYLDIEGTYLKDGSFLAEQIEDKTYRLAKKPYLRGELTVQGKIEKVDGARHVLTVMGATFTITDRTQTKSVPK